MQHHHSMISSVRDCELPESRLLDREARFMAVIGLRTLDRTFWGQGIATEVLTL
jgi:hypothetical protein